MKEFKNDKLREVFYTKLNFFPAGEHYIDHTPTTKDNTKLDVEKEDYVKGRDVIIPFSVTGTTSLAEMQTMAIELKKMGAKSITLVAPFLGYGRQDKKSKDGWILPTNEVVAKMMKDAGIDNLITFTPHSNNQIKQFEDELGEGNVYHFDGVDLHVQTIKEDIKSGRLTEGNIFYGGLDGFNKQEDLAFQEGLCVAIEMTGITNEQVVIETRMTGISKTRKGAGEIEVNEVHNSEKLEDNDVTTTDDMTDSAGTVVGAGREYKAAGAKSFTVMLSHGIFAKKTTLQGFIDGIKKKEIEDHYLTSDAIQELENKNWQLPDEIKNDNTFSGLVALLTAKAKDGSMLVDKAYVTNSVPRTMEKLEEFIKISEKPEFKEIFGDVKARERLEVKNVGKFIAEKSSGILEEIERKQKEARKKRFEPTEPVQFAIQRFKNPNLIQGKFER